MNKYFLFCISIAASYSALSEEHICEFVDTRVVVTVDEAASSWKLFEDTKQILESSSVDKDHYVNEEARRFIDNLATNIDKDTLDALFTPSLKNALSSVLVFTLADASKSPTPLFLVISHSQNSLLAKWVGMYDVQGKLTIVSCNQ